jgi:signal transduction histidine kinase
MSIKSCVVALTLVLVAAALSGTASVVVSELGTLIIAARTERMMAAFDGLLEIRYRLSRERGSINALLVGRGDEADSARRRAASDQAFDAGFRALDDAVPNDSARLRLMEVRDAFMTIRATATAQLARGELKTLEATTYLERMLELMERLDALSSQLEHAATVDAGNLPRIYIELARLAATLRDQSGRRASYMTELAAASIPLTAETAQTLGELAGEVHAVWSDLDHVAVVGRQISAEQGKPPARDLDAAIERTRNAYFADTEPLYRAVITALRDGLPADVETMRLRQSVVNEMINQIRILATKSAVAAVAEDVRTAWLDLAKAIVVALLVGAGAAFAILALHLRVVRPMEGLARIVSRLAENHIDDEVPALKRTDEIGRLARAIETLRRALQHASQVERERQTLELQLRQAQKLESLGTLAGGIAHEINTPAQYVGDNIQFLKSGFADLTKVLDSCATLRGAVIDEPRFAALAAAAAEAEADADLAFLRNEIPTAIAQSLEGIDRVRQIVLAVKEFAHPDVKEVMPLDLNHVIETTIMISRGQWKHVAELVTDLSPELPPVPCRRGEINQVILNLIVNAAHAIEAKATGLGKITVTSGLREGWAEIRVCDTGTGIPSALIDRIFDPFFTTKAPGKGTGQGLAICHTIVVQKHGGEIAVDSTPGEGTTFTVRLPLEPALGLAAKIGRAA